MPWVEIDGQMTHINIVGGDAAWERMSEEEKNEIIEELREVKRRINRRRKGRDNDSTSQKSC